MEKANLDYLFTELIRDFSHLLTINKQTKQEFMNEVDGTYSLSNGKTMLFYDSINRSTFNTIRLNSTRTQIIFNQ